MKKKKCKHDAEFQRSITFQRDVEVDGELDTVGKVETFSADAVKIVGDNCLRVNCGFYIV